MTIRLLLLAGAALGNLVCVATARAATQTTTFTVKANVVASCSVSATDLDFGDLTSDMVKNTGVDKTSTVSVNCTNGASGVTVGLVTTSVGGTDGTGTFGGDIAGQNKIQYGLFQKSDHSLPWGSTGTNLRSTDDSNANLGTGSIQTLTVYGHIAPQPTIVLTAGQYTDTVTVTVNF